MVMMVLDRDAVPEAALPVAELADKMRLPDGWETVPGQFARMGRHLAAAIASVETRTGKVLLRREVTVAGSCPSDGRTLLPIAPVQYVVEARVGGVIVDVPSVEPDVHHPVIDVSPARPGMQLQLVLDAGFGSWADVPPALAQAVLIVAEGLELALEEGGTVRDLIAPWRPTRLRRPA